mmetsp:Transcript_32906/g.50337  ORF Transcript_32906/g.50337 Transcript_32906/m.50337 type:complete len:249 (-) Transcript_32906:135-881(-)|eukprot:CAMPEP_0118683610 /NCGR_PEP_ID=MMETSP0800-20121206/6151_1 /TAXON_ID=210618 ORGANISM="Striatella unipunctata, Strain CCMP2910" /NCGR_SAMPLE_ID=MMETSP0800 /ASSEMBLY_ACC=CAM_ASM_000638 /LENGTH=248 /DNA_ID=CAMNT_0006580159 /DNA_START=62 /DNA_END=808 /DNA_ORIENTATION=+
MWLSSTLIKGSVASFAFVLAANLMLLQIPSSLEKNSKCICPIVKRPDFTDKVATARWMVKSIKWGVLTTISSRLDLEDGDVSVSASSGGGGGPVPFGNVYSFVDGTCDNSTGFPYLYGTFMDQSFEDTLKSRAVSLTLSEAALDTECLSSDEFPSKVCSVVPFGFGDPENPLCARLVLTGVFKIVDGGENTFATNALMERHPSMTYWPQDHNWEVAKIEVQDIWLIDYFGGASIIKVEDYLSTELEIE